MSLGTSAIRNLFLISMLLISADLAIAQSINDLRRVKMEASSVRAGAVILHRNFCPSDPDADRAQKGKPESALIGPLVAIGTDFLINAVGDMIKEYNDGLTGQFAAGGLVKDTLASGHCFIVTRGYFGTWNTHERDREIQRPVIPLGEEEFRDMGLAELPAFYLELKVSDIVAGQYIELQPIFLSYAGTVAKTRGSGIKHVTLSLALSESSIPDPAKATQDTDKIAVLAFDFGKLQVGRYYEIDTLLGTRVGKNLAGLKLNSMLSLTAIVTETEDATIALTSLKNAFESNKADLNTALKEVITEAMTPEPAEEK